MVVCVNKFAARFPGVWGFGFVGVSGHNYRSFVDMLQPGAFLRAIEKTLFVMFLQLEVLGSSHSHDSQNPTRMLEGLACFAALAASLTLLKLQLSILNLS